MESNPIVQTYRKLNLLLNQEQKRKGIRALVYSALLGLADLIALGATVPILVLTIDKSFLQKSSKLRWVYEITGLETEGQFLILLIGIIFIFFVLKNIFGMWFRKFIKDQCAEIATDYAGKLYSKYLSKDYLSSAKVGTSEMIDKLIYYPFQLSHGIIFPFITFLTEFIAIVLIVSLVFLFNPFVFAVLLLVMLPSLYFVFKYTRKRLYKLGVESDGYRAETIQGINIGLQGLEDIKFNDVESHFLFRYKNTVGRFLDSNLKSLLYQYIPSRFNEIIAVLGIVVFAIYGYFFSENVGGTRLLAALFALSIFRLVPALNKVLASLMSLKTYQRVLEEEIILEEDAKANLNYLRFEDSIQLKDVGFSFEDNNSDLFQGINLTIPKGRSVGIYGESGNGKSTLLKIITGIIRTNSGVVCVDENVVNENNYKNWQNQIAYVSQIPFILNGSLWENVALGEKREDLDKGKMINCLKEASLNIFFDEWEQNLDIPLGETGSFISEGQKQRICIARALYKDVKTLVLDEATSALDEENERQIQESIKKLLNKDFTILIIAHKQSFLSICDDIYKLEKGKLTKTK